MLQSGMPAFWVLLSFFALLDPAIRALNRATEVDAFAARIAARGAPASQPRSAEFDWYLALLGRYESGDYQGAADAAARLGVSTARAMARQVLDDVDRQMVQLKRLKAASTEKQAPVQGFLNQLRRERVRRMKLTVLVHTEAALVVNDMRAFGAQLTLAREAVGRLRRLEEDLKVNGPLDGTGPEPGPPTSDEPSRSQELRAAQARREWEAMQLFIRDWYLVVASRLQASDQRAYLKTHVRDGLELFKDDPELLLARGAISESEADTALADRSLAQEIYTSDYLHRWRQFMSGAGGDYEAAARRRPDLHEATLRWGRVNAHLGDRKAARRALEEVAASDASANLRYMAHLFLGDLAEREEQADRARAAYEAALALFPNAQAPMLALSVSCDSAGDLQCARRWLSQSLAATGRGRLDPWWTYQFGQAWLRDARLAAFRAKGVQK